jgi:hypothetical protein
MAFSTFITTTRYIVNDLATHGKLREPSATFIIAAEYEERILDQDCDVIDPITHDGPAATLPSLLSKDAMAQEKA